MTGRVRKLIALGAVFLAAGAVAQQLPVIGTKVTLVNVLATVKDPSGALVGSLLKDAFEIYENGVKQEIAVFERRSEQPLSVVLMIDTSGSTGKDLKYETESASRFLKALLAEGNAEDAVALYGVNADVTLLRDFTHNYYMLEQQFKYLRPEGATAMFTAVQWASQSLEKRSGRKVIVLVTDGDDTYSRITPQKALEAAHLADAVIYPIVVVPIANDAGRSIGGEHALEYFAHETGGRVFMPALGPGLDKAFADVVSELRTQYLIAYYPRGVPPSRNRYHSLDLRVNRSDLKVSARTGYYSEAGSDLAAPDARVSVTPAAPAPPQPKARKKLEK
jgi:Ca-activated chloride channel homolog